MLCCQPAIYRRELTSKDEVSEQGSGGVGGGYLAGEAQVGAPSTGEAGEEGKGSMYNGE